MKKSSLDALELIFWVMLILGLLIFLEYCADRTRRRDQTACRRAGGRVVQYHADDPRREGWTCVEATPERP